jgi:hypothetical protein
MKKFTLTTLLVGLMILPAIYVFSQKKVHLPQKQTKCWIEKSYLQSQETTKGTTSIFTEDFSSGTFPPSGWAIIGLGQTNWSSSATAEAGGTPPEAMLNYYPSFNGNSKLVTPAISTSGMTALLLEYKHMLNHYGGPYSVLVETSSDGTTWNEVWSIVDPTGSVGPETVFVVIDNDDVGSDNFQVAFTFSGDSFNLNYWYIDDIILSEALSFDASVSVVMIPGLIPAGNSVTPGTIVKNLGSQTITFDVSFEIMQASTPIYTAVQSVTNLPPMESLTLSFDSWVAIAGSYTAQVTTNLTGDENPANDILTKNVEVVEGAVAKKPLFEVFTSSTCSPCAQANPIIDAVFAANPDEFSLIKYQMDWPGSGDPYYTEQGGIRKDYYGVSYVPDFYCNGVQDDPFVFDQAVFDSYAEQITAMTIELTTSIDEDYVVNAEATINPVANYPAGLKAHIVVVERVTVANVGSNGETEFHNVMMVMIPDAVGTALGALNSGVPVTINGSYDMSQTFMEQPNDLAVVVFVQDDTDKSIIQSEILDVGGSFATFNVTFNVSDSDGNPVDGAEIFLEGNGSKTTNSEGQAVYNGVFPGSFNYDVSKAGLEPASGSFDVTDQDVTVNVVMNIPDYYYYEDFGVEPTDWTMIFQGWNSVYWYSGQMILFNQGSPGDVMLISPQIDLSLGETLFIEVGNNYGDPSPQLLVGTVPDPADPGSFTLLETLSPPVNGFEDMPVDLTNYTGTDAYLAFKYQGPDFGYFYIETVKIVGIGTSIESPFAATPISVYPNPAKNIVNINSVAEIKSIKVYNYSGQLIKDEPVLGNFCQIITSDYNSGIYLFRIETDNETITQRVLIE